MVILLLFLNCREDRVYIPFVFLAENHINYKLKYAVDWVLFKVCIFYLHNQITSPQKSLLSPSEGWHDIRKHQTIVLFQLRLPYLNTCERFVRKCLKIQLTHSDDVRGSQISPTCIRSVGLELAKKLWACITPGFLLGITEVNTQKKPVSTENSHKG